MKRGKATVGKRGVRKVKLPPSARKYVLYVPLHALWEEYAATVMGKRGEWAEKGARVYKMDLVGAKIEVVAAKAPSLMGLAGIVIAETAQMFTIITSRDCVKQVSKAAVDFRVVVGEIGVVVHGPHFLYRAGERVVRKPNKKTTMALT